MAGKRAMIDRGLAALGAGLGTKKAPRPVEDEKATRPADLARFEGAKKPGKKAGPASVDTSTELAAAAKALAPAVARMKKAMAAVDPKGLPIGALADLLYDLRQLGKQHKALIAPFDDLVEPVIKAVEEHFVQTLAVGESSGVQGLRSRVQVTEAVIPVVETANGGWEKLYAYIKKTGSFELLGRALNRAAVIERWDAKKQIPGVGKFHAKKVSCTKLGGK
jgi:hypothetical protein